MRAVQWMLVILALLGPATAHCDEYIKAKVLDKTPSEVFAAAERVVRNDLVSQGNRAIRATILERDERTRLLRFRLDWINAQPMSESKSAFYAIFVAEAHSQAGKTNALLRVGIVPETPPLHGAKPTHAVESSFSQTFFRLLKSNLHP